MNDLEKIKQLKEDLKDVQSRYDRLIGNQESIFDSIKENFKVKDIDGAKKKIKDIGKQIELINDDIEKLMDKLLKKIEG